VWLQWLNGRVPAYQLKGPEFKKFYLKNAIIFPEINLLKSYKSKINLNKTKDKLLNQYVRRDGAGM
jgi:hypothetical protein